MSFRQLLGDEFPLSAAQLDSLERHRDLLEQWNRRMNLIRFESERELIQLHYRESLLLGQVLPPGPLGVVDVGSGAGFPGIPVAILRADLSLTLVDSHQRKTVFLREATRGLANVEVVTARADRLEARWDWAISRAVRPGDVLKLPLSSNFALLVTQEELEGLPAPVSTLRTSGQQRLIAMFHVERDRIDPKRG